MLFRSPLTLGVTLKVNGGRNGLAERSQLTAKAKAAIARIQGLVMTGEAPPTANRPVLRRGSQGEMVGDLQRKLQQRGFSLAIDEDFGAATEAVVMVFQRQQGLEADGIVGRDTWNALDANKR